MENNEKTSVTVLEKGPIIVEGKVTVSYDGVVEQKEGKIALCRCGYSQKKPFCDGNHRSCPVTESL
jgi:CDGSH-type Zn-finger protein